MCLFSNPSDLCDHQECIRYYLTHSQMQYSNSSLIAGINTLIQQQSIALSNLVNKNNLLNQNLDSLTQALGKTAQIQSRTKDEHFNIEDIFRWISSGVVFNMFITLTVELPEIIYKEKGFNITANVLDSSGTKVNISGTHSFLIALFTVENPPKLLKTNISGKKILRGTTETIADQNSTIQFHNLVINEVTSHYPNDSFCLVILCPSLSYIKPLATSGISIRARKHRR